MTWPGRAPRTAWRPGHGDQLHPGRAGTQARGGGAGSQVSEKDVVSRQSIELERVLRVWWVRVGWFFFYLFPPLFTKDFGQGTSCSDLHFPDPSRCTGRNGLVSFFQSQALGPKQF